MGKLLLFVITNVAVATRILTRSDTGTAFIQSTKPTAFFQDTVDTTINVEIYSPRVMLDYTQYTACDLSYEIK